MTAMNSRDDANIIAAVKSMLRKKVEVWRRPSLAAGTSQPPELVSTVRGEIAPSSVGAQVALSFGGAYYSVDTTDVGTFIPGTDVRETDELRIGARKWTIKSIARYDHVIYAALAEQEEL